MAGFMARAFLFAVLQVTLEGSASQDIRDLFRRLQNELGNNPDLKPLLDDVLSKSDDLLNKVATEASQQELQAEPHPIASQVQSSELPPSSERKQVQSSKLPPSSAHGTLITPPHSGNIDSLPTPSGEAPMSKGELPNAYVINVENGAQATVAAPANSAAHPSNGSPGSHHNYSQNQGNQLDVEQGWTNQLNEEQGQTYWLHFVKKHYWKLLGAVATCGELTAAIMQVYYAARADAKKNS